jgi:uncharacterized membrane protein
MELCDGVCVTMGFRSRSYAASSTFTGEGETVVQLLKWVRMQPLMVAPVGVVFVCGGDGGGVSRSIVSGGKPRIWGGHH